MKRVISSIFIAAIAFGFSACSSSSDQVGNMVFEFPSDTKYIIEAADSENDKLQFQTYDGMHIANILLRVWNTDEISNPIDLQPYDLVAYVSENDLDESASWVSLPEDELLKKIATGSYCEILDFTETEDYYCLGVLEVSRSYDTYYPYYDIYICQKNVRNDGQRYMIEFSKDSENSIIDEASYTTIRDSIKESFSYEILSYNDFQTNMNRDDLNRLYSEKFSSSSETTIYMD